MTCAPFPFDKPFVHIPILPILLLLLDPLILTFLCPLVKAFSLWKTVAASSVSGDEIDFLTFSPRTVFAWTSLAEVTVQAALSLFLGVIKVASRGYIEWELSCHRLYVKSV